MNQILPFSFEYNGDWLLEHVCNKCKKIVSFGEEKDKKKRNKFNIHVLDNLFTKYYDLKFLESLNSLFPKTIIYEVAESGISYLTFLSFSEDNLKDFNIPIVNLINYSCTNCETDYLCRFRKGYPIEPDPTFPHGKIGEIFIDDLIQVSVVADISFKDIEEQHKIVTPSAGANL